ncbi:hypothetical protein BN1110_02508 [bacterium YEK0313]|nr:hypothetical protein BN1110_02508 [bacterium YEK0313]
MIARRSFLAVMGGGLVAASLPAIAQAGAGGAAADVGAGGPVREVSGLRRALGAAPAAGEPREMQYYIVRRRYYVRRYYYRPRRRFVRCWWNGYGRVCRYW